MQMEFYQRTGGREQIKKMKFKQQIHLEKQTDQQASMFVQKNDDEQMVPIAKS